MKKRVSSAIRSRFTGIIKDVMNDLGRPVEVFKQPSRHECLNCYYDKLTNSSTGDCKWTLSEALQQQSEYENSGGIGLKYRYFSKGRCPICKGKGFLETIRKVWIKCKVTWDPDISNSYVADSVGVSGSTNVELKTDPKHLTLFRDCVGIRVDGLACTLAKPPILRGIGGSSLLIIMAFTSEGTPSPVDSEVKDYT
jgi:hypothetical protein